MNNTHPSMVGEFGESEEERRLTNAMNLIKAHTGSRYNEGDALAMLLDGCTTEEVVAELCNDDEVYA
jgi:hypothetical protein